MQNNTNSENHTTPVAAKPLATQKHWATKKYSTVYKNNFQGTILHHFPQLPCMWTSEPLRVSVAWLNIVNEERETDRMTLREKERLPCAWWGLHNNSACQERVNHPPYPHKHDRIKYLKAKAALPCFSVQLWHLFNETARAYRLSQRWPQTHVLEGQKVSWRSLTCTQTLFKYAAAALWRDSATPCALRDENIQRTIYANPASTALHFLYIFQ